MAELLQQAAYYLLMLAGSVSLGKTIFLLASGGGSWLEGERATGLASITGLAVVLLALATEFVFTGAAFPAVLAFGGGAAIGTRALLFKKPFRFSTTHLEKLVEEVAGDEGQSSGTQSQGTQAARQAPPHEVKWAGDAQPQRAASALEESGPTPAQKIGEVMRLEGGKAGEKREEHRLKKVYENNEFEEIKWA